MHGALITWSIALLAAVASGVGLLVPSRYGDTSLAPAMRGQDLLKLDALAT